MGKFYCYRCKLDFTSHVSWHCPRCGKDDQVGVRTEKEIKK